MEDYIPVEGTLERAGQIIYDTYGVEYASLKYSQKGRAVL